VEPGVCERDRPYGNSRNKMAEESIYMGLLNIYRHLRPRDGKLTASYLLPSSLEGFRLKNLLRNISSQLEYRGTHLQLLRS
jgi:hypothetical protein